MSEGQLTEERLIDFDYAIFAALPEEGSQLGYHPLVKTTRQVASELNAKLPQEVPPLRGSEVATRIRVHQLYGFAVRVRSLGGSTLGWQRTERATAALRAHADREKESK